ncbi:uncharacterized protein LOC122857006 [Aphidius gifuensis]|uniref:uncharacterized protein LOC122857006 n=1 Tax=Aphidius gifuensis TaxID=684658 RepID=UPI001CDBA35D|nr:uncharacterized protein LOC122857006 [Aphidius gifuensis]
MSSLATYDTPAKLLCDIKQRLIDEGKLSEDVKKIIDESIAEEEKYIGRIVRVKIATEPETLESIRKIYQVPFISERSERYMKAIKVLNKKRNELKLFCKETKISPTMEQLIKRRKLLEELTQLEKELDAVKSCKE